MTENHGGSRTSRSNSYMEQENEWVEREGLLDPAWEQQQKKVRYFTFMFHTFSQQNATAYVKNADIRSRLKTGPTRPGKTAMVC